MLVEAEKEIAIIEVAEEVPQDRSLKVQILVEVESGGEEVGQVAELDEKITKKQKSIAHLLVPK